MKANKKLSSSLPVEPGVMTKLIDTDQILMKLQKSM